MGTVKVGLMRPRKGAELAIVRLPVKLKDKAGKYAHIFEEGENEVRIIFSDSDSIDITVMQQTAGRDIERRLERLERMFLQYMEDVTVKKGSVGDSNIEIDVGRRRFELRSPAPKAGRITRLPYRP